MLELEQHSAFVRAESEKYRKVIREMNIKLEQYARLTACGFSLRRKC
jgi:hypothetical protein